MVAHRMWLYRQQGGRCGAQRKTYQSNSLSCLHCKRHIPENLGAAQDQNEVHLVPVQDRQAAKHEQKIVLVKEDQCEMTNVHSYPT